MPASGPSASRDVGRVTLGRALLVAGAALLVLDGCIPLLTPHGEGRGTIGVALGRTRTGAPVGAALTATVDTLIVPTPLAGCRRDFDLGFGVRFHFVEPEDPNAAWERIGGVLAGTWFFAHGAYHRGLLRLDLDALALDGRALMGFSLTVGAELFGITDGEGIAASWEGVMLGAWSGEAGVRAEATVAYHDDFADVRYATFTAGIAIRWPAGAGIGIINPVTLAMAASSSGARAPASTGTTASRAAPTTSPPSVPPGPSESFVRGCPEPDAAPTELPASEETAGGESAAAPTADGTTREDGRFRCTGRNGMVDAFNAESIESAGRACELMLASPCTCAADAELDADPEAGADAGADADADAGGP